jgi:hypothetical protein
MPFGGVEPAGMGRYYGKYGFEMLTHARSMPISPPDVAIDHLLAPFTPEKNAALMVRILNEVVRKSIDSKHKITNNASEFLRLINWYKVSTLGNHM